MITKDGLELMSYR